MFNIRCATQIGFASIECRWLIWAMALLVLSVPASAIEPIPTFYQEPGLSPNRDYVNQQPNEHIDPFTGKLQLHYVDLFIPGNGGMDIKIQRSYNSINELLTEPTALGVGWTMHFGRVLRRANVSICDTNQTAQNAPVVELPDGSRQILYLSMDLSYFMSQSRWRGDCSTTGVGFNVTSPEGIRYEMTTIGQGAGTPATGQQNAYYTTRIVDRNGNTLDFTYVTVGATTSVSTITASDGRLVNFTYSGNTLASISDGARTWNYTYTYGDGGSNYPFLTQVQRPDGLFWQYDYNLLASSSAGTYSMKRVTYPAGGYFDYTYGFVSFNVDLPRSTVISQKVGAGGTWTYSYTPATMLGNVSGAGYSFPLDAMLDKTVVTAPDGVTFYQHVGANSVGIGAAYSIGLLMNKSIGGGMQYEVYGWDIEQISATLNLRPGSPWIYDLGTYAIRPTAKVIVRDNQAYQTQFSNYDAYGNARTITETGTSVTGVPDARVTQMTFDVRPARWMLHLPATKAIDIVPGTVGWTYDTNGNLLSNTQYGVTTQYTYMPTGDIQTKTDARSNVITYSSYMRGIPRQEVHPESVTIVRTVDNAGNISSQTDGENVTTSYAYDGLNRLTSITHPVGNPVSVTWLANERRVQRGSYLERLLFDSYGREFSVEHQGGPGFTAITQTYVHDPLGRKEFTSYPNQTTGTATRYDALGRVISTMHVATPLGPNLYSFAGGQRTSTFDQNRVHTTNERGIQYTTTYRAYGNPDESQLVTVHNVYDPDSHVDIVRNGLGQALQITQGGKTRTSTYNTKYFLTQSTDPEVGTSLFGRDAVGNMISRQVGTSGVTQYTYDGRNRLRQVTYPSGTPSVTRDYYRDDLIKFVDNGVTRRDYVYGVNKQLSSETLTVDSRVLSATYTYNQNDALQTATYGTGLALAYNPDPLGRPTQATPFVSTISYHPSGQVQTIQYANGASSSFGLNARQWPNSMSLIRGDSVPALNMGYVYDNTGNVQTITESVAGLHNRTFGYDGADRLTNVTMPNVPSGVIAYDGRGNILSQSLGTYSLSYQYDSTSDRLNSVTGSRNMTFTYDVYGNVTNNSRNQFVYDDALNMRCADCNTANEIRYVYDGAGMRVSEQKAGLTTYFMYGNGGNLLFEIDTAGVKREYGYVAGKNVAKKETH